MTAKKTFTLIDMLGFFQINSNPINQLNQRISLTNVVNFN